MFKKAITYLASSMNTKAEGGASARKLSAFAIMICVVFAHIAWLKKAFMENNFAMLESILVVDYGFIAGLLGMTTYEAITTKKLEKKNENTPPDNSNDHI